MTPGRLPAKAIVAPNSPSAAPSTAPRPHRARGRSAAASRAGDGHPRRLARHLVVTPGRGPSAPSDTTTASRGRSRRCAQPPRTTVEVLADQPVAAEDEEQGHPADDRREHRAGATMARTRRWPTSVRASSHASGTPRTTCDRRRDGCGHQRQSQRLGDPRSAAAHAAPGRGARPARPAAAAGGHKMGPGNAPVADPAGQLAPPRRQRLRHHPRTLRLGETVGRGRLTFGRQHVGDERGSRRRRRLLVSAAIGVGRRGVATPLTLSPAAYVGHVDHPRDLAELDLATDVAA